MSENSQETNELDQPPSELQNKVNDVAYRGVTSDFEGWFIKGTNTYIYKLKQLSAADLKILRDAKKDYEKAFEDAAKALISDSQLEEANDILAMKIHKNGLDDFTDEDWDIIWNDPQVGRGSINRSAEGLYVFLMEKTTPQESRRLLKQQLKEIPSISDISRDYRKSGTSTKQ